MKLRLLIIGIMALAANIAVAAGADANSADENKVPTKAALANGQLNYERYCSSCHGKDGQGGEGPALKGSKIVTGPIGDQIEIVLHGKKHMKMPAWGISELSDAVLAKVVTYQRNAWGNNDKKQFGKHAGGVVTPKLFKQHRKALDAKPIKDGVRT